MAEYNQPVVVDNGSGVLKAGFAGGELPQVVFPSYVGTTKHLRMMAGGAYESGDTFVGSRVQQHRGLFSIKYAMEHGIVTDWDRMQRIWEHMYSKDMLNITSDEHPVLLTEAPLNPAANRVKAAEVFFESFNAPAFFVSPQAVLSLYASGRTTGVVLDVGDGVSHVVPVYESFTLPHAITRMDVAGRDVTNYLQLLCRRAGYNFQTSAELEVVKEIKEKLCYVAFNPTKEEQLASHHSISDATSGNPSHASSEYRLPDGNILQAILRADLDLRRTLFSQIILSGGSTLFPGFGDRLLSEVRKKAPKDIKIRISAPPARQYSTWIGGSILASLATFKTMWITKAEYEEHGASIVHRKTI
ncbi:hypothetical protein DYB28_010266 [Aphanomyces astaci]|uniref:Actin-2 n=1 Tax=Aphanomyces astaci TaxID=112090 RepID=A0A397CZW2_APHAT|nr:hypothetical protein DYB36_001035 [Aphanomyces astaci]RHY04331.1 hypothetical protein DYB25_005313 [Aphanomyces astaci]RHY44875.1 hypothetical protein DYB34_004746 [Aphanomyces astaci]RHY56329.1 hypothetical protein DYB38_004626 [Aphanomyces astaci]RHY95069.1 hypothetical protein DYB31_004264 [Aphanomyces astaci]